jgi:hypothetical protein
MHSIIMVTRYNSMYSSILVLQRHVSKSGELEDLTRRGGSPLLTVQVGSIKAEIICEQLPMKLLSPYIVTDYCTLHTDWNICLQVLSCRMGINFTSGSGVFT